MRLILNPGGCAEYRLPVDEGQKFAIIHPARKDGGGSNEVYGPKATVDIGVKANEIQTNFFCFTEPNNMASTPCVGSFESVLGNNVTEVSLNLCVNENDNNTAALWEIDISKVLQFMAVLSLSLQILFSGK